MSPENFCYWLQGRVELLPDQLPTKEEWEMIKEHLNLVFDKVTTPVYNPPSDSTNATPWVFPTEITCSKPIGNEIVYC